MHRKEKLLPLSYLHYFVPHQDNNENSTLQPELVLESCNQRKASATTAPSEVVSARSEESVPQGPFSWPCCLPGWSLVRVGPTA